EQMLDALRQVVAERGPSYIYKPPGLFCKYERNGVPSCGVGVALAKLGVPVSVLTEMDFYGQIGWSNTLEVLQRAGWVLDAGALGVAKRFQTLQDNSETYEVALI